jgi:predicted alpha/beta superfamily hydrolase/tetratricopeptide (TPR) repeat protein
MTVATTSSQQRFRPASVYLVPVVLLLLAPALAFPQADGDAVVIGTYRMVPSQILGEDRRILVHLPRGYEASDRTYPVVYKLHGAPLGFFAPISASIDLLAESGRIPQAILVGVEQHGHWEMRPRDAGGPSLDVRAEEFLQFLTEDLTPFVDRNYRTKDLRILMGTYDCGLFALYALLESPGSFSAYLANSIWFRPGGETVLDRVEGAFAEGPGPRGFFYLTEWEDAEGQIDPLVGELRDRLEAGAPSGFEWGSEILPYQSHDRWLPYKAVEHGLLAFFEGYECPEEVVEQGLDGVTAYYAALSHRFGVALEIPEMAFNHVSDYLTEQRRWEEAIEVLRIFRERYPRSLNAVFRLARAYRAAGDLDNAVESYRAALAFENCPPAFGEELRRIETSAAFEVERSIVESGLEAGVARFRALRADEPGELEFREGEFNEVGYRLLGKGMVDRAIAVLQMNVEMFPESANAYDSLGEAYAVAGDTALAVENYRKSLELNPQNTNAQNMLRRLGASE